MYLCVKQILYAFNYRMKRIDSKTQQKLYWLFIPLALVVMIEMTFLWFNINLIESVFGMNIDILAWCKPALLGSVSIIFIGYGIAALKQKCWEEFAIALTILVIMLLNVSGIFVKS